MALGERMNFLDRWMIDNDAYKCFSCWDKDGYHPERSDFPEDAQLVCVTIYSYSTIMMDGFITFFESSVGDFAPEVASMLKRLEFSEAGNALLEAMFVVGGVNYPRSSDDRIFSPAAVKARLNELSATFCFALPEPAEFSELLEEILLAAIKE